MATHASFSMLILVARRIKRSSDLPVSIPEFQICFCTLEVSARQNNDPAFGVHGLHVDAWPAPLTFVDYVACMASTL